MGTRILGMVVTLTALIVVSAQAFVVEIGRIDLSGNFTLNHNFDFNNPSAQPFGSFGNLTTLGASGIFTGHVAAGDPLLLNSSQLLESGLVGTIGGFSLTMVDGTLSITGPDSGRFISAAVALSGNGFDANAFDVGFGAALGRSFFTAPPYDISNFPVDITGPINFTITESFENGIVSETGSSLALLTMGIAAIGIARLTRRVSYRSTRIN